MFQPQVPVDQANVIDDITAACNSLGKMDENDGTYMKDRDCKPCLKEIMRSLNADSKQHVVRTTIGTMNIVKSDLIPLINQYCDYNDGDLDLFSIILRLCSNLTSSVLLLFENQKKPVEPESLQMYRKLLNCLYGYKLAFANDEQIWKSLNIHLRHTEDEMAFERLIILIRNILHIPVDSTGDLGLHDDLDAHEMCLIQMDKSGMLNTITKIASDTQRGTEFCFHITEIIYLILRDKNPATIANAPSNANKRKHGEDDPQLKSYLEASRRDKREKEMKKSSMSALTASSRFRNSAFLVKNIRTVANNPMIVRKPITSRQEIELDMGKTELRKSKNRKPFSSETSSIAISDRNTRPTRTAYTLKVFCKEFLEKVYANYMQQIKHNLIQKKSIENDETYYLWALQFFTAFNRHLCMNLDNVAETLSTTTMHFIQVKITEYHDQLKIEKDRFLREGISKRLHLGIRAYREILLLIKSIQPDCEYWKTCQTIKKNIFTDKDYNQLILNSFQEYDEPKYCREFLEDLILTNHDFLEMIEEYVKENNPIEVAQHFVARYCSPDVIKSYVEILKSFKVNKDEINLAILRFLKRVAFDCHYETMLLQVSVLKCLMSIMDYHNSLPGHEEFVELGRHLMVTFGRMANMKRWMYQEVLFWKTSNDVVEIENAVDPPPIVKVADPEEADNEDLDNEREEANLDENEDDLDEQLARIQTQGGDGGGGGDGGDDHQERDDLDEDKEMEDVVEGEDKETDQQPAPKEPAESQSLDDLLAELGSDSPQSRKSDFELALSSDEEPEQVSSIGMARLLSSSSSEADESSPRKAVDKSNVLTISDDEDDENGDNKHDSASNHDDDDDDDDDEVVVRHPASDGSSLSDFPDASDESDTPAD